MKVNVKLSVDESMKYIFPICLRNVRLIFNLFLGVVCLVMFILNFFWIKRINFYFFLPFAVFFLFVSPYIYFRNIKKQLIKQQDYFKEIEYDFLPECILMKTFEQSQYKLEWDNILKILDKEKCFLLIQKNKIVSIIKKEGIESSKLEEIKNIFRNKNFKI